MRHAPLAITALLAFTVGRADALVIESATRPDFAMHDWQIVRFDRDGKRPAEVGGKPGDMSSLITTDWDLRYTFRYTESVDYPCSGTDHCCRDGHHHHCGPARYTITVQAFNISGKQRTRVYLPKDAPELLDQHERAHLDINSYSYDQAFNRARTFSRGMLRRTFTAESIDKAKEQVDGIFKNDYLESYRRWRDDLHQALNDLDGNGRGTGMKPADAYRKVLKERGG